jgi:hypothetical protein
LTGYTLYINVDGNNQEVIDLVKGIDFVPTNIQFNKTKLGPRENPYNLINRAFEAGALWVCHFDSDLVISPDAFNLLNWYYETFKANPLTYMSYGLFTYCSGRDKPCYLVRIQNHFNGLGWAIFPENWNMMKTVWFDNELSHKWFSPQTEGFDWSISALCKEKNISSIIPCFSRTNHIGRIGTYCSEAWQQKAFDGLDWNNDEFHTEFIFIDEVERFT